MTIGTFSVRNPVLINITMIIILVVGGFSLNRLPREQFAEIPFYFINISVPYPGVSAEDVESSVTVKIENEMSGIDKLDEISSTTAEGSSQVTLQFEQDITEREFDSVFQDVQNRFSNIDLPDGTLQETIDDFSTNDFLPVIEVVLSGSIPYADLNQAARNLSDQLRTVPEVSQINLIGSRDRQIAIALDRRGMESRGIAIDEVVNAVRAQNVTIPGGTLRTDSREFLLRTVGEMETEEQFRNIVVRTTDDDQSGVISVGDLATVSSGYDLEGTAARFNGEQAISLQVTKVPGGSSVGIIDEVRQRVGAYEANLPDGVEVDYFNDSSIVIRDSLDVLVSNAAIGLALLVVILLIFVGVRNAIITAVGIPLTFALTFIVLDAFGETLNSNTLFGLVLVLGLIVDHAIVIVENSYRLQQQQGMSRHDAAVHGVNQVIVPVIAATLTTVAAFLPLTFLPGIIGRFLRVVPLTVSIALIASTFEAAVFLPSHYADWPGGKRVHHGKRGIEALQRRFRGLLEFLYRHRGVGALAAVAIAVVVFAQTARIQPDLFDSEDATLYYVDIEMPPGTPIERTDVFVRAYEQRLLPQVGNGEVVAINAFVGFAGSESENVRRSNVGQIVVDLTEEDEGRTRSITEIMNEAQQLTRDIPGAESVQFRKQQGGPPTDPPVAFRLYGDSYDDLRAVARRLQDQLAENSELFNISDDLDAGTPEIRITVDEDLAAGYGLNAQQVGTVIRQSFDGITTGSVFVNNEETDVVVEFSDADIDSVDGILQLRIPTSDGRVIPFSRIASLDEGSAISSIRRIDGKRQVQVTAEAFTEENVPAINDEIRAAFDSQLQPTYPGVTLDIGGEFAEFGDTLREILRVFVIGIFLIYLILATQFNSYTQPLLILLTVPFAFVGVILFLLVSGTPLSTTVIYASVALAGIAVNDTIVLITFANQSRRTREMPVGAAVTDAAVTRLRPILLTSITTIAGLVPTAIGLGGYSVVWGPMARTIIFGLVFSTITTLIIVPSFYGLFYDHERRNARRERRRTRRAARRAAQRGRKGAHSDHQND
ncbi:MAG: efflux RND transporter permease subunit [Alkalispirochaeta sp.]